MQILVFDVHSKEKHMEYMFKKLGKINAANQKTAKDYILIRKEVDKVNYSTQNSDLIAITYLAEFLKTKKFKDATRDDVRRWSNWLKETYGHIDSTVNLYQMKAKRFYKYVSEPDKYENGKSDQKDITYPDSVRWITYDDNAGDIPLDSMLSEKEILSLFNACRDTRDQAIICCLLDGGLRKSELLSLNVGNVGFDKKLGAYCLLPRKSNGQKTKGLKTGTRKVQFFLIPSSTPYIREYLNHHPYKDDPENAPFIYSDDPKRKTNRISEIGLGEMVARIIKHSGIKKHITPHILRHNSATMCCKKGFNEPMLRERYGWSARSKMPSRYVHLANVDMDDKIKKILGIKDDEKPEESLLQTIKCWNCSYENPCSHKFCGRCSASLKPSKKEIETTVTVDDAKETLAALDRDDLEKLIGDILIKKLKEK